MTTAAEQALATLSGYRSLLLEGKALRADVAKVLRDATVSRTIDGASTLTLDIFDDASRLLRSNIFSSRLTMQVDSFAFELVQVRKTGPSLSITLEDLPVAALRRHDKPMKVGANTTTHVDFARRLVAEERWLKFETHGAASKAKVEMARGKPDDPKADKEDTWKCIGRIADERGWRRYVKGKDTIVYVPETWLVAQPSIYRFTENSHAGVESIDYDFDIGKKVASLKVKARAARWAVPIGSAVDVYDMGPVNGKWLVSEISRSLFSLFIDITLTRARPTLPEPVPPPAPSAIQLGAETGTAPAGAKAVGGGTGKPTSVSAKEMVWPVTGRISSPFGHRASPGDGGSTNHQGLDIAAAQGTPVRSAKGGTVTFAGTASGYGNVVYMDHGGGVETRYGHLSKISTRRGVRLDYGEEVGLVGATGHATGPHLHFEVRVGGVPKNPEEYLP